MLSRDLRPFCLSASRRRQSLGKWPIHANGSEWLTSIQHFNEVPHPHPYPTPQPMHNRLIYEEPRGAESMACPCSTPSHSLHQCWYMVNRTLRRKFSEIWIKTLWFFFARFLFKMLFAKLWPFSSRTAHSKTKQISGSWIPKFPLKWHFEISRAVTHNEEAASFSTGSFDI